MQHSYYNYTAISTATTTNIKDTAELVVLHTVIIPKTTSGTITFQDIAAVAYFTLPASTVAGTYEFTDIPVPNGLAIVTSAADNAIIVWKQG